MKKAHLLITTILFICVITYIKGEISYGNEIVQPKNQIVHDYIYNDLDRLSSKIHLTAKTIINADDEEFKNNKEKYLKEIDFIIIEINSLILDIQKKYSQYKDDNYTLNSLYAIGLILNEYRFALTQLEAYILAETDEDKYINLQSFYVVNSEANSKLSLFKTYIPKS